MCVFFWHFGAIRPQESVMTDYLELNNCPIIRKENQSQDQSNAGNLGNRGSVGLSTVRYFGTMMIETILETDSVRCLLIRIPYCFAWVLMPNHVHLLLQTGDVPVAIVIQRLLTGYGVGFNRHR